MSLSNSYEVKLLDHLFMQTELTQLTNIYVSLHSASAGETGANELAASGNYSRALTAPSDWNVAVSGATTNANTITFDTASADWNSGSTIGFFGLWDHASETTSANFIGGGVISIPRSMLNGDTAKINAGTLIVSFD